LTVLGIIGIIAFLTILALSLAITRIATIALTLTGLSVEAAKFQARSAFTGTGFTTSESEKIVGHPVRRRVVTGLMVIRSAGFITIILSLILSFGSASDVGSLTRLIILAGGSVALWLASQTNLFDRLIKRVIQWALNRWTQLWVSDYAELLNLSGDYVVTELEIQSQDWLAGKAVADCRLHEEGVTILGIHREDGNYVGVPKPTTQIRGGDRVVLYGREEALRGLDDRIAGSTGDWEHNVAVERQGREMQEQDHREEESS
jgi:hypothetical protein